MCVCVCVCIWSGVYAYRGLCVCIWSGVCMHHLGSQKFLDVLVVLFLLERTVTKHQLILCAAVAGTAEPVLSL